MEIVGLDHGYAAMKTAHFVFPSGVVDYGGARAVYIAKYPVLPGQILCVRKRPAAAVTG